jgi:hypothetical protein
VLRPEIQIGSWLNNVGDVVTLSYGEWLKKKQHLAKIAETNGRIVPRDMSDRQI